MLQLPHTTGYLTERCADDATLSLDGYRAAGGYRAAHRALRSAPDELVDLVERAGLRERDHDALPVASTWRALPEPGDGARYLVCNAMESEPGSFRDRLLLERASHLVIEGILIAARATGAECTFLCVRGEYDVAARAIAQAVDEAREAGVLGRSCLRTGIAHDIAVLCAPGAAIAAEPTAILEWIEGRRAEPRRRRPPPAEVGAFGRPTAVHGLEALCHLPRIVECGAEKFREIGAPDSPGTALFGVSGHVVRPGLYELPLGTRLDEIIFEHARGVPGGRRLKAVLPGGLSTPVLPAGQIDVAMADEPLRERGSRLGTGAVVVMDDTTCPVRVGCVATRFHQRGSCGRCAGCREGSAWLAPLFHRIERGAGCAEDLETIRDVAAGLEGGSICGFADRAAWPVQGLLRHFREDFEAHVRDRRCPFPGSFEL